VVVGQVAEGKESR